MLFADASRGRPFSKDPAVVRFQGHYYLYYSVPPDTRCAGGWGIGIAGSDDLEHWEILGELEPQGELEAPGICAPGAIVVRGQVHLFYQTYTGTQTDAICHAYSQDGIHFTRNPTNPIVRAQGRWNNARAIDADVVVFENRLYLYFATRDPSGNIQMLGVTSCPMDGQFLRESWRQCCDAPILAPRLDWEKTCIEAPAALVRDNRVYLFYAGAYNNAPQQIGLAVSEDAVHFTRVSSLPFLPCGEPGTWNSSESGHPFVFEDEDGRIYLFYQGNCDNGKTWTISKAEIVFDAKDSAAPGIPRLR